MARPWATAVALALAACPGSAFVVRTPICTNPSAALTPSKTEGVKGLPQGQNLKAGQRSTTAGPVEGMFSGYFQDYVSDSFSDLISGFKDVETTLPQDPKANTKARKKQLEAKQEDYMWTSERNPVGLPFLDTKYEGFPPPDDLPTAGWLGVFIPSIIKIIFAVTRATIGIAEIVEALSSPARLSVFTERIAQLIKEAHPDERPFEIEDYIDLHKSPLKMPESVCDYEDDDTFARLRLQGHNAVVIEKCTASTRAKLKILDSDPDYKDMKEKVDSLLAAGKLFVVDHELIKDHQTDKLDDELVRYLAPSIALFEMVDDDDLLPLRVIGIQLSQGETATPIFTPKDDYNWLIAKACFEAADFIIHEVSSHLGSTHCVLEGPMTALNRQLPEEHPVHALLHPHTEGTAFINWGAQYKLIAKGGGVDRLLANRIEDSWDLVLKVTPERISKDFTPMADFEDRQMTTKDFPGKYPYRDFGLKYYEAINTWVSEYLDLYYKNDVDIANDYELMAFVDEVVDIGLMSVADKIRKGPNKLSELKKFMASLIYTASVLHSAVNFPQKPIMAFAPMVPGSVYQPPPTDKKPRVFQDYLDYLPPMEIATTQVFLSNLLGSIFHTKLGEYNADQFSDDRVAEPLIRFQLALDEINDELEDDNTETVIAWRQRGKDKKQAANFAYKTLLKDGIPQSINI